MAQKKRGLGRGLTALMSDVRDEAMPRDGAAPKRAEMFLPVEKLRPNPDQPRRSFGKEALEDLAASVREYLGERPAME